MSKAKVCELVALQKYTEGGRTPTVDWAESVPWGRAYPEISGIKIGSDSECSFNKAPILVLR